MTNPNENCLEGMRCPKCQSYGPFTIHGDALFEVHDDGSDEFEELSWEDNAVCKCKSCGLAAKVSAFEANRYEFEVEVAIVTRQRYVVHADSIEEAEEKAMSGETEEEETLEEVRVSNREIVSVVTPEEESP